MDIQAKLQAGKGPGYERWAKIFNLKQMAQTINFLTENNITDYESLIEKTKAATDRYHELSQQIKEIEKRMAQITELKKHIINYSKTKNVYTAYQESGYSKKFYEANTEDILLHQTAKKSFNQSTFNLKTLNIDYQSNKTSLKLLSREYQIQKHLIREINTVAVIVDSILCEKSSNGPYYIHSIDR